MRYFFAIIISSVVVFGCNKEQKGFEKYYDEIPVIKLPLKITCGLDYNYKVDSIIDTMGLNKYRPKDAHICGRLDLGNNKIYIIYSYVGDILYPYLFIYDENGKKLDSLYLHLRFCSSDENMEVSDWSIINADKTILMVDTTRYYHIDTVLNKRILSDRTITKEIIKPGKQAMFNDFSVKKDSISYK